MTRFPGQNRRKYDRYETDVKVQFYVSFDIQTKVDFRVKEKDKSEYSLNKYSALSRNVSVEGISFISEKKVNSGDVLFLEIFVPAAATPVRMEGQVRWCEAIEPKQGKYPTYETGVRVVSVKGSAVEKTIFIDDVHKIAWSIVLESIFGSFKHLILKRKPVLKQE
jgi:hypothetical protein